MGAIHFLRPDEQLGAAESDPHTHHRPADDLGVRIEIGKRLNLVIRETYSGAQSVSTNFFLKKPACVDGQFPIGQISS
jgi:hypothetical protein